MHAVHHGGSFLSSSKRRSPRVLNEALVPTVKGYIEKIESELAKVCEDIPDVLEKHILSAASGESKIFYLQDVRMSLF